MAIKYSYFSEIDPSLKRILDEIATRAVNGNITPLFVDRKNLRIGIRTITPYFPLDIAGSTRVQGTLHADNASILGMIAARNIDIPGTGSFNRLAVSGRAFLPLTDIYGNLYVSGQITVLGNAPSTPAANTLWRNNIVKAWVNFNGATAPPTINGSFNVSSVTVGAAGNYVVSWGTAFLDTNYACVGSANQGVVDFGFNSAFAVGSVGVRAIDFGSPHSVVNLNPVLVIAIGSQ